MWQKQLEQYKRMSTAKKADGMSESYYTTLKAYVNDLMKMYKEINYQHILNYVADKDLQQSSKATVVSMLSKFAVTYSYITNDDVKRLHSLFRRPRLNWSNKAIGEEELNTLIKVSRRATTPYLRARNSLLVYFLASFGMRIGQALNLKSQNVMIDNEKLVVKIIPQKKRDPRENLDIKRLRLNYDVAGFVLEEMYNKYIDVKVNSDYFFSSQQGHQLSSRYIQKLFEYYSKEIDHKITPHTLRHYVGSKLANEFGLEKTAIWLGHENINTTSLYLNPEVVSMEL